MKIVFSVLLSLFSIFLWVILHHFNLILSYPIVYWGFILLIIFRTLKERKLQVQVGHLHGRT